MATKTKALPKKPATVVEQIGELVDKHIDTVEAIIETYSWLSDAGMDTELRAANEKLKEFSEGLEEAKELSFVQLISKLQDIKDDDFDMDAVMDLFQGREYNEDRLIKLLDVGSVEDYFIEQGYAAVKLNNMLDRDKLETFLKTEIYPLPHDQNSFLII